jgi:hypothetical protein
MADKTIKVKVDVETDVEPSIAQLKALKKQLKETAAGSEEFSKLQQQINDTEDAIKSARTGASNFTEVLGQLPGPIGEIGNKVSGAVNTLKQFGGLKITNLQSSFVELGKDLTDIAKGFGQLTGITKVYTTLNAALSKSFIAVGIGEQAAAAGAKAFAAALTATGIGAIIVGLGLLIANWDKVTDAVSGATAESKTYEEAQVEVTKSVTDFNKKLIDVENSFKAARAGTISKKDALQQYNDTLGKTIGYAGSLEQAEALMAANTAVVIESIKLRTQANVFYAKSAEAAAKAVAGEGVEPTFWQSVGDYISSGGNQVGFIMKQSETLGENYADLSIKSNKFAAEGDKLTTQAIENDKKLKKGLAKPPDFTPTTKASNDALNEIKKALEEARLALLDEQAKELEQVKIKYDTLVAKARKFGKDTTILEQAREKENSKIREKFAKQELDRIEKAAKEETDKRNKQLQDGFAKEEALLNLRSAKGEITEKEYQIQLYNLRKEYAILNQALGQDEIDSALKARNEFNEEYKTQLKTELDNELRTLTISRNEKEIELKDDLDNKKITKKQYNEQLLAIDKEYNAKEADVRNKNQSLTEAGIKEGLEKEKVILKTELDNKVITQEQYNTKVEEATKKSQSIINGVIKNNLEKEQDILKDKLDNKKITQEQYEQKSLELARKYSSLAIAFAYETLQKEEAGLKTALDNREITQSEYDSKLLNKRKEFAGLVQQQSATEIATQEANLKTALDTKLNNLQAASQKEEEVLKTSVVNKLKELQTGAQAEESQLKSSFENKLKELQNAAQSEESELKTQLENKSITQQQYDANLLEIKTKLNESSKALEEQNSSDLLQIQTNLNESSKALEEQNSNDLTNIKTKLNSDSVVVQTQYDTQIIGLKEAALAKNKDLVTAEIDLEKYKVEQKKLTAEEERGIIATRLQSQIEALDAENARIEGDFEQDLERLAEKRELLKEQEINDLANTDLTEFQKTEIRKKYADARKGISDQEIATEKAAMEAKHEINMAYLGLFEQFGNVLSQVAGKNKALAIAGIVISQAAAIGQIIASTGIANAKAAAASPLTFGQPWVTINTVSAALSIASTIAGAVKSIQQINSAASQAGVTGGGGGGSVSSAPNIPAPRVAGAAAPEIQTTGGQNPNTQLAETLNKASAPIKAYVVSGDISSQQALDRRTSRAATFSGG